MMSQELSEDLEIACLDAIRGDPPSPSVARRLEWAVQEVLKQHGWQGAKVQAKSDRSGTAVQILLPKPDKTVEQIVLKIA